MRKEYMVIHGHPCHTIPMNEMTFEQWMEAVDVELINICGLGSSDLTDVAYMDMYEDGYDPEEAARQAWEEQDY